MDSVDRPGACGGSVAVTGRIGLSTGAWDVGDAGDLRDVEVMDFAVDVFDQHASVYHW